MEARTETGGLLMSGEILKGDECVCVCMVEGMCSMKWAERGRSWAQRVANNPVQERYSQEGLWVVPTEQYFY